MLHPAKPARRPRGGELRPQPAGSQNTAQGHQRRLASLRAELLPPLSSGRPPCGTSGYINEPRRIPMRHSSRERNVMSDRDDEDRSFDPKRRNVLLIGAAKTRRGGLRVVFSVKH